MILASDTVGPLVVLLFLGPIALGLIGVVYLAIKRTRGRQTRERQTGGPQSGGRRSRWGLIAALVPLLLGAFILFFLLTVRGGAPQFFYVAAALPVLVGIKMLQVWSRGA